LQKAHKKSLALHKKYVGKIEIKGKVAVKNKVDLSLAYTPGVGQVCLEIAKDPKKVFTYTIKKNMVAVISDGSAVLGLVFAMILNSTGEKKLLQHSSLVAAKSYAIENTLSKPQRAVFLQKCV
jgi:hypothetical protein